MSHFRTVRIWNVLILLLPKTLALSVIANLKRGVFKPGFDGQFDSLTLFQHLFRFQIDFPVAPTNDTNRSFEFSYIAIQVSSLGS